MSSTPQTFGPQARKLINVIPVGLKEAALDSPSFRASTAYFFEQIDTIERWLDGYVKATTKLSAEVSALENVSNGLLSHITSPFIVSESVLDNDYATLALKRYGDGARDFWSGVLSTLKKAEAVVADPIRTFINGDLRTLKEARRCLDHTQKQYDHLHARYASQAKTKEPSSLREDAFQLHEARKAYLKASMDFCVQTPQIKSTLEKLLIHVFYNQWREFKVIRDNSSSTFSKFGLEMERIKGWTHEMENTEQYSRRELLAARKEIEDAAELAVRPSRELEDYSISTVPFLGSQGPASAKITDRPFCPEKQGWVSLRVFTGKPTRTIWVRRWAFLKSGIFGCLVQGSRTGGVEESERIGVLLCSIRPAFQEERRFCFEVKTKSNTIMLQAETQKELTEWIGAFEAAKRKALESPKSELTAGGKSPAQDPAFAISQPPAPEFAAEPSESLTPSDDQAAVERTPTLPVVDRDGLGVRNSGDFATMRRSTAVDRETDGARDHASRIKHKLDLHRRANNSPQQGSSGMSPNPGSGSISSLISSSNAALPLGTGTFFEGDSKEKPLHTPRGGVASGALAPPTLVNPPTPTSMSNAAVTITYERGISSGLSDSTGSIPAGIMANSWGSTHWGLVNRVQSNRRHSGSMEQNSDDPTQAPVLSEGDRSEASPSQTRPPISRHRPTVSLGDAPTVRGETATPPPDYPASYPQSLKLHDAQFRLLFPDVPRDESLVFVFRATFSPNDQQDFPGRAFATTRNLYFYSNYSGLVLASCVCLNNISEVTAAPGRDCDFLFLHIIPEEGSDVPRRLTVKTFLDPLKSLRKRLNFLVSNAASDQPGDLDTVIKSLMKMESEAPTRASSFQGWDDSSLTPVDERPEKNEPFANKQENRSQPRVYVDKDFRLDHNKTSLQAEASKFKLPSQPVEYVPQGAPHLGAEKTFDVAPKVLFHLLFGDKSPIWQQLQLQRTVQDIKQGPWTNLQSGHKTRSFEYCIQVPDIFGKCHLKEVSDYQIVDVLNEHLCYVVTDKRTPWHLPFKRSFRLVSKIVVTHVARSKCKLAVYTKVEWIRQPYVVGSIIDKQALNELDRDALDLVDLVAEQVRKLGPQPQNKMAISMFGHLGQEKEVVQLAGDGASLRPNRRPPKASGLLPLLLENSGSFLQSAVSSVMMWMWGVIRWIFKSSNANRVVTLILFLSLGLNFLHSYHHAIEIWNERRAGDFMNRLGLGPHGTLSKAVYIRDLDDAIAPMVEMEAANSTTCFSVFRDSNALGSSDMMPSPAAHGSGSKTASYRLQRSRQHLSTYRHDLLVALRLVNRVEKEVLQAEWERWVLQESRRCKALGNVLNDQSGERRNASNDSDDDDNDSRRFKKQFAARADLEQWYKDYCLSCQREQEQILNSEG